MTRALMLGAVALAACTDPPISVQPVIDLPVSEDVQASAFPLDTITLTVAHAGSDRDLVAQTFGEGAELDLPGVPFADDLVIHMEGFLEASNVSYGRTCTFALAAGAPAPTPHLFFSRSVKFADLPVVPMQRFDGRAIEYLGTGLFIGGLDAAAGQPVLAVEQFDPMTGELVGDVGDVASREGAVDALVGTSPPLIALIGGQSAGVAATYLEVIDPGTRVERVEDDRLGRVGLTATSLTDGSVVVIGGQPPGMPPVGAIDVLAANGATVDVTETRAILSTPRAGHTATRLGDDLGSPVLIAGGLDAGNLPVATAELFKPLTQMLSDPATFAPVMVIPRSRHAAVRLPDGSVLIIGGVDATGTPIKTLELFSVDGGFITVGDLPSGAGLLDFTTTTLADGRILITGGRTTPAGPPVDTAFLANLDPMFGTIDVVATDRMAAPRANHQATLLCDGTVLIGGGTDTPIAAERYNPPAFGRR